MRNEEPEGVGLEEDFTREVRPAPPRRRITPPRVAAVSADGPSAGAAGVGAEMARLTKMVAGIAEEVSRIDDKISALAGVVRAQRDQKFDVTYRLESLEETLVTTVTTAVESAFRDLLSALDHELSEQFERSVAQGHEMTEALQALTDREPLGVVAVRKGLSEVNTAVRGLVRDQLARAEGRERLLEEAVREVLAELTALKRRLPLRAGDQALSADERERLAALIARHLIDDRRPTRRTRQPQGGRTPPGA